MKKNVILSTIALLCIIVGTIYAMGDRFISKATFLQFKEFIVYRFDTIDKKLDILLEE